MENNSVGVVNTLKSSVKLFNEISNTDDKHKAIYPDLSEQYASNSLNKHLKPYSQISTLGLFSKK